MSKRSQQAKDKLKAERERKKRWGQQQKALHASLLNRDLTYYEERGLFNSSAVWNETASQVLWDSQEWRHEPEFRDLALEPYRTGQAMALAWQELKFDPVEFNRLADEEKDDRNFELNAHALALNLTPEFKKDVLQRLERYRRRLRAAQRWEALAQAGLVQMILETSDLADEHAWPECMLIYQLHHEAVGEYVRLQEAAEAAMGEALQALSNTNDNLDQPLTSEQETRLGDTLEQAAQHTPGLLDYLTHAADDLIDVALVAVQKDELRLRLFTKQEIDLFFAHFLTALVESGAGHIAPEDLPLDKRAKVQQDLDNAVADCMDEIDTPERRVELYQAARLALKDVREHAASEQIRLHAVTLLPLLDDENLPLAENEFFSAAISGESDRRWRAEQEEAAARDEAGSDL
jgi:hypothetical protein